MEWFALVISFIAVVISFLTYLHSRRQLYADTIARNRIEWIQEVRELISEFLTLYLHENQNTVKMKEVKCKIELYMNGENEDHKLLAAELENFIHQKDLNVNLLVRRGQVVLNNSWRRMKIDAGISAKRDKKIKADFYNDYPTNS